MKYFVACALILTLITGCTTILEQQVLPDAEFTEGQEDVAVDYKPLTYAVARAANEDPFVRNVIWQGYGKTRGIVSEAEILRSNPPQATEPIPYRLGVGDVLTLTRFVKTDVLKGQEDNFLVTSEEVIIPRVGKVGEDGSFFLVETGRVELGGKSLEEARAILSNALVRNGIEPRFDLEITEFASQQVLFSATAPVGTNLGLAPASASFPITDVALSLRQLLASTGIPTVNESIQVATLVRGGRNYRMTFDYIFGASTPEIYLTGGDRISVNYFNYKQPKGFLVGSIGTPTAFPISPERRQNLADILFVRGGAFDTVTARTSEIYVMRGTNPVTAMHLDAKNPARVRIAAELELRPNDVVFVSEKPIYSLGNTIRALLPVNTAVNVVEDRFQ